MIIVNRTVFIALAACLLSLAVFSSASAASVKEEPSVSKLVGEKLNYDISFLWFDRLASGTIALQAGDKEGTFLVQMEAETLGIAAFLTGDRVEKYQTLMFVDEQGMLRPLWHSAHSLRNKDGRRRESVSRYDFDYRQGQVSYSKIKDGRAQSHKKLPLEKQRPLYDILSALYNLRLGFYGDIGQQRIIIPTIHRKGPQEIVIEPLSVAGKDKKFFGSGGRQVRIEVDPEVFGTNGRDVYARFDEQLRPNKGIIKGVIGLGDVRGTLVNP